MYSICRSPAGCPVAKASCPLWHLSLLIACLALQEEEFPFHTALVVLGLFLCNSSPIQEVLSLSVSWVTQLTCVCVLYPVTLTHSVSYRLVTAALYCTLKLGVQRFQVLTFSALYEQQDYLLFLWRPLKKFALKLKLDFSSIAVFTKSSLPIRE